MADKPKQTLVNNGQNGKPDQGTAQFGENGRAPVMAQLPAPPPPPPQRKSTGGWGGFRKLFGFGPKEEPVPPTNYYTPEASRTSNNYSLDLF